MPRDVAVRRVPERRLDLATVSGHLTGAPDRDPRDDLRVHTHANEAHSGLGSVEARAGEHHEVPGAADGGARRRRDDEARTDVRFVGVGTDERELGVGARRNDLESATVKRRTKLLRNTVAGALKREELRFLDHRLLTEKNLRIRNGETELA